MLTYSNFVCKPENEQAMDYLDQIFDAFQYAHWTTFAAGVAGIFPDNRRIRAHTMQILSSAGLVKKPYRNAYTTIYNSKFPRRKTTQAVWMISGRGADWVKLHRERHQSNTSATPAEVRV